MRMLKGIIVLVLILTLVSPVLSEADTKYEYSDWSPWQTESISSSETLEVETRTADITETKTEYSYEYWRYWNSSSGTYLYKGNASRGGTYYSVTLPSRLKYYSNTSDGASYIVGGGKYINFKGECWFNEKEVKTSVVTGKKTEYRYRERTKVDISDMEVTIPITENSDETPGIIRDLESSKSEYAESDNIIISWSSAKNAFEYGLTVRKSPYTGEQSIVYDGRISGNSVNIGTLEPGSYRFAMRAYSSSGDKGPISKIIYFCRCSACLTASCSQYMTVNFAH
jgi:hypothetical protein